MSRESAAEIQSVVSTTERPSLRELAPRRGAWRGAWLTPVRWCDIPTEWPDLDFL